jgi:hypothetical protein
VFALANGDQLLQECRDIRRLDTIQRLYLRLLEAYRLQTREQVAAGDEQAVDSATLEIGPDGMPEAVLTAQLVGSDPAAAAQKRLRCATW